MAFPKKILVVDDEKKIVEVITSYLQKGGYKVDCAFDGSQALKRFQLFNPDLIILDLMLPDISGEKVCMEIRKKSGVPIIMLTAKSQVESRINGLELGADDYIVKPFSPQELMARVRAILRRTDDSEQIKSDKLTFANGYLEIDTITHEVKVEGKHINLTPSEYKILITMCKNPQRVFSRDELVIRVFGYDYTGNERAIDTHIKNLRQKIEKDSKHPQFILTVHGFGYKFGGGG
ncbi:MULTISPECIES: response regulator transcription factor [Carboxydocella]|uniref:Stage 0 sporulation protein A homolog n=2 Tax=Carboxydocella TaxID=178898 RepID=A0A1T4PGQ9_9FIRM|nr:MULTISPECIES: response regulator transcription factor [Carboxydocella]AVX21454.1 DNA-binding response regulator, OmpR family, contains REC and winged-helix (wHTH) domain [Carboxydocella thermautotrophica]AVX31942.1 DNA-binding response regulator, OmpR family, contains REC and winged-helix (wHTH) domain [Carboxydocella thermautotrophica]SJZ90507.1 DNA-binding response regulator, OmpR family, contains REC and winged-helix (wHTH) domain [Carboxydocella sporoproducens DSM 16521]GAW29200.1 two-co